MYRATLRDSGKEVALKVQRPNIPNGLELDFHLIREGAKLADGFVDSLNTSIVELVDEFAARVFQELNYVQEGINAERFARLYGDRPDVVVPGIEWDYTSPKVITMDWIQGTKLSDQESLKAQGLDVLQLVDTGIQCSLRQLLEYGYFHADPHPGNLLATPEGKLAFLDFGMMSETPERARYAIIEHVVHLVNRDYEAMAQDYYALEFLDESVDVAPIVPALAAFFDDVLDASVEELNFKTITDGLGGVLYQYPFNVPGYYALILRSLTVLEGLALSTDPKFKVLGKAYPYMARRLLTDPRPQLRDAFSELLFKDKQFRWNRLENLLREGSKNDDYNGSEVIPPLIELVVGEDAPGEVNELRPLVEAEAIKVLEALLLGQSVEAARSEQLAPVVALLPEQLKRLPPIKVGSPEEEARMMELRTQVLRVDDDALLQQGLRPRRAPAPHGRAPDPRGEAVRRDRRVGGGTEGHREGPQGAAGRGENRRGDRGDRGVRPVNAFEPPRNAKAFFNSFFTYCCVYSAVAARYVDVHFGDRHSRQRARRGRHRVRAPRPEQPREALVEPRVDARVRAVFLGRRRGDDDDGVRLHAQRVLTRRARARGGDDLARGKSGCDAEQQVGFPEPRLASRPPAAAATTRRTARPSPPRSRVGPKRRALRAPDHRTFSKTFSKNRSPTGAPAERSAVVCPPARRVSETVFTSSSRAVVFPLATGGRYERARAR